MDKDRIGGTAQNFAGRVERMTGDLAGDTMTQEAGREREVAGTVQNMYGQAKDAADAAANYARDAFDNSGEAFRDGSQAVARTVQGNPISSLLIAGGIGFAMALLMMNLTVRRTSTEWRY